VTAVDDSFTTGLNTPLSIGSFQGVLANDSDDTGQPLTAIEDAAPLHGALTLQPDGSFDYTPNQDFQGVDTFTYHANDGTSDSNIATVSIGVAPPVSGFDSYSTVADKVLTVGAADGVLANDSDPTARALTAVLDTAPAAGSVTLHADGSFIYTPGSQFVGSDSFSYHANDGLLSGPSTTVFIDVTNPIQATFDSYTTVEDKVLSVDSANGLLANDRDTYNNPLTAVLDPAGGPASGSVTVNADGSFTYTPSAGFLGLDSFTYHDTDGTYTSDSVSVSITVNSPILGVADNYVVVGGRTLTADAAHGVLNNDADAYGTPLTAAVASDVTNGTLSLAADGSFTYTPNATFSGFDSFTYTATDGTYTSDPISAFITIQNPVSVQFQSYTVVGGTALTKDAANGVLKGAADANSLPLKAAVANTTTNGTLTLNDDGSFTYTPKTGFTGFDSFLFTATDGAFTSTEQSAFIQVSNPIQTGFDSYTGTAGQALTVDAAHGVLANDTDANPNGQPLTAAVATGGDPAHGTLTLHADGSFTYTPTGTFTGFDEFTYQVSDGTFTSGTTFVSIDIPNPISSTLDSYSTSVGTALTIDAAHGVLANDTDANPSGQPLTAAVVNPPSNGTVTLAGDGSFTYTPDPGFVGDDAFSYTASDGTFTGDPTSVTITVNSPVVAQDDNATILANTTLTVDAAHGVLANDTTTSGNPLHAVLVTAPTHGTLTLNADGSYTYTPDANFVGSDFFAYKASDGTSDSLPATDSITVNSPVSAGFDFYSTTVNKTLVVAKPGVLANDTDANHLPLTAIVVSPPQFGTLSLSADGSFTYTPDQDYLGSDFFTYKANDGAIDSGPTGVSLEIVSPVTAVPDDYTGAHDTAVVVDAAHGVLANDTDSNPNAQPLTATLVDNPTNGTVTLNADGSFTYTPNLHFAGQDEFTYQASDGKYQSGAAVFLNITGPVTATVDFFTLSQDTTLAVDAKHGVLANDVSSEGKPLTAVKVSGPSHGALALASDGSFTYTPTAGYQGGDSFTYEATDGTFTSTADAQLTINGPIVAFGDNYTTTEGAALTIDAVHGVLANDTTTTGNPLTATLVFSTTHGALHLNLDGSFTYTPDSGFNGFDNFIYTATDGTLTSNNAVVSIKVNSPVVANSDSATTKVNTLLTVDAAHGVLANDTDSNPNGQPLQATLISNASHGTVTLYSDGSYTYTPDQNYVGFDGFSYKAGDGTFTSDPSGVFITIESPAVAVDDLYTTPMDAGLTVDAAHGVLANDTDSNGDPLTAILVSQPSHGTVTLHPDGSFTYTPNTGFFGSDSFEYKANDGTFDSVPAGATIGVESPVAAIDDSYATTKGTAITVDAAHGVLANDTDSNSSGQPLTATLGNTVQHGTLSLASDGSFTYTPNAGFQGADFFEYTASDGTFTSLEATVQIVVNGPVAALDDSYASPQGATLTVDAAHGVLANDTDANHLPLTASLASQTTFGTVTLAADGSFTYTPTSGQTSPTGTDQFTYTATDGTDTSNTATVTITLTTGQGPTAVNDAYSTNEGQVLAVDATHGVLANDTDGAGKPLTATLLTNGTHGTATLGADGSFSYTPDANFSGVDSFTYKDSDDTLDSAPATVTISVNFVNQSPTLDTIDDITVLENAASQPVGLTGISAGPAGESGQTLTVKATSSDPSIVPDPIVDYASPDATGALHVVPASDAFGSVTITVTVQDDGGTANGGTDTITRSFQVTVAHVNQAPTFTKGADQTPLENAGPVSVPGWATAISAGPANESSQNLTFMVNSDNPSLFDDGPAVAADGTLTFTPATNAFGSATVTITLMDDGGTANGGADTSTSQTFTITVTHVNQAPTFEKGPDQNVLEDAPAVSVGGWATAISPGPANESSQNVTFVVQTDRPDLFAVQPAIATDGTLTYTVAPGTTGSATVSVQLMDDGGTANGGRDTSAMQTFTINVGLINQSPSFLKGADQTVFENAAAVTVAGWATSISPGPANEASQHLNFIVTSDNTALFSAGPAIALDGTLTFTPAADEFGVATVTVMLHDDGGTANGGVDTSTPQTFVITVNHVNQVPSFTKGPDQPALDTGGPQTIAHWATAISAGAANESGQALTFQVNTDMPNLFAAGPAIAADGTLTFTPATNSTGTATVTVRLSDDGGTANGGIDTSPPQAFLITVTHVNQAPSFTKGADQSILENAGAQTISGWATAISAGPAIEAGQALTFLVTSNNAGLFAAGPAVSANGTLTYTPAVNAFGTASVTVRLKDDGDTANNGHDTSAPQTFTIVLALVNHAPSFVKGADQSVNQDSGPTTVAGWATAISAGPASEVGQTLTFGVNVDKPALFAAGPAVGSDGTLTFTPASGASGTAQVTVTLTDNGGTANGGVDRSAAQSFTITINPLVNHLPVLNVVPLSTIQGVVLGDTTIARFTDADGEAASAFGASIDFGDGSSVAQGKVLADGPNAYRVTLASPRSLDTAGTFNLKVTVTDPGGGQVTAGGIAAVTAAAVSGGGPTGPTNANTLTYSGSAPAGFVIQVIASGAGLPGGSAQLGQTTADAGGHWSLTVPTTVVNGSFTITARVLSPGGAAVGSSTLGSIVVDTAGPQIASISLNPATGKLTITFLETGSGLSNATLLNSAAYSVSQIVGKAGNLNPIGITSIVAGGPNQVILTLNGGKKIKNSNLRIQVTAGPISDNARNALDGEFAGAFPSGNGKPGGDFVTEIDVKKGASAPKVFTPPSKGKKGKHKSIAHPVGPLHLMARMNHGR
jgi:VCBS repeat-containing protein